MAVGAIHGRHVAEIYWTSKFCSGRRGYQWLSAFGLRQHRVANIAVFADHLAFGAHVIAIVTSETS
jgi:hypothetical protein